MMSPSTLPTPVRSFEDPITGAMVHQLTEGPEPSAHLYFTRCSWLCGGKYFLMERRINDALNFFVVGPDGVERQVTNFPPSPAPHSITCHMHRRFIDWEGVGILLRLPAIHPALPQFVYARLNEIHLVDIEAGTDELLHIFPQSESEQPFSGLHASFTADGKHLILTTTRRRLAGEGRLDPPEQDWNTALRAEDAYVSKIWRYDFEQRKLEDCLFASNGEQSHLLTCPWDADGMLWVNYLHSTVYTLRRDGSGLRRLLDRPGTIPGHYSWDVANRRLSLLLTDCSNSMTDQCMIDPADGVLHRLKSGAGIYQWHQNPSPDGRWIVTDTPRYHIGVFTGLHLIDLETDTMHPLCQIECSWNPVAPDGGPLKSEFLHPNPSWSPDGRYVVFGSDFGGGMEAAQVYAVDVESWTQRHNA